MVELRIEGLRITQDDFTLVADWALAAGGRVAVIGPSGAGKSTLLNAIAGFFPLTGGRILWDGTRIDTLPAGQRPLSILFQDQNLFPHLTVAQNLGIGLDPALRRVDWQAVDRVLDRVGLTGLGGRRPAQLSGGQQSRAALARALLRARPILLLDEPFAALGPALKSEMLDLVAELAGGALVLMVTHDPNDARHFASQTVLVADGRAEEPQETGDLFAHPPPALAAYLGATYPT
ncbi:thiamine ABC transporter ATP-binding protein [Gemmobacter serpentinus]|uniref:thiamine ABC transporter ATP-binding protein n=1 Tax=Gemmobacter serpentinus TaxID=2652247 RepID=UPI00124C12E0|nr:ATP-binding cassette domain-containing protein [Gemmobacter serpentinus]